MRIKTNFNLQRSYNEQNSIMNKYRLEFTEKFILKEKKNTLEKMNMLQSRTNFILILYTCNLFWLK